MACTNVSTHRNSFQPRQSVSSSLLHPYLSRLDTAILNGQACAREALSLRDRGWYPDVVISHVGFGNGLFQRLFSKGSCIGLVEWFYNSHGSDVDFLNPNNSVSFDTMQMSMECRATR